MAKSRLDKENEEHAAKITSESIKQILALKKVADSIVNKEIAISSDYVQEKIEPLLKEIAVLFKPCRATSRILPIKDMIISIMLEASPKPSDDQTERKNKEELFSVIGNFVAAI